MTIDDFFADEPEPPVRRGPWLIPGEFFEKCTHDSKGRPLPKHILNQKARYFPMIPKPPPVNKFSQHAI